VKILILDDKPERQAEFRSHAPADSVVVFAQTPAEAIALLEQQDWDLVFLEHDLGGGLFLAENDPRSGQRVAEWLASHPERMPKRTVLHSPNDEGRSRMHLVLPEAISLSHAWTFPISEPKRDSHSLPIYYPLEDE